MPIPFSFSTARVIATAVLLGVTLAEPPAKSEPVFREVTVHDPSVVNADGTLYVFGSHLAAAKTEDLISWSLVADGANEKNPLFRNVHEELKETFAWAETRTLWAPDVVRLRDGRYAMYYCACKGDSPRSALGLAIADRVEGPYRNQGTLLKSGMWGQPSEDGTVYEPRIHPNAVDPHTFFDTAGQLWMVYGSYSGGIFILKMDSRTGKPLPGQGYGKHLAGGNHARIEGPYILFSPKSNYYYLFLSFGGLDARGGYNVRVARSRRPDGPFFDAAGHPMSEAKADAAKPLFDDRSVEPFGTKLMGNFRFDTPGEGHGYVSPGHNSAMVDEKTGRHFLIFHTRFPGKGEGHQVRVHELHLNRDGWPVIAPYRYAGEPIEAVAAEALSGTFQAIEHGQAISAGVTPSKVVRLEKSGVVSGAVAGRWQAIGKNGLVITTATSRYDGVALRQWQPETRSWVVTFSVLSREGQALWGVQSSPSP